MKDRKDLTGLTDEELVAELGRRRAEQGRTQNSYAFEVGLEDDLHRQVSVGMQQYLDVHAEAQTTTSKPCPKCGKLCRVRRQSVRRKVKSLHGELFLRRHYHYCGACKAGWYPLDIELALPDEGEATARLEQVVLDLGLHGPFEEAAERFSVHHRGEISENLVRRVIDRVGRRAEARTDLGERLRAPALEVPSMLVVQVDGSMLPTRGEDPWREVKVGLVARGDQILSKNGRGLITEARFVARLGDFDDFKKQLTGALALERAWECERIVFVGDGANWVWTLADEVCHGAIQILDYPHAVEHANDAAQAIFGIGTGLDKLFVSTIERMLWDGRIDDIVHELEACAFLARGHSRSALVDLVRYYRTNAQRMRYDRYRRDSLPCGSGAIESAHRHVLQKRMKLAGQHWAPARADRFAQLRAALATCGSARIYSAIHPEARLMGSYG
jgi:hypothetical protein